jgi:hypothetical protein
MFDAQAYQREYHKIRRADHAARGLCRDCDNHLALGSKQLCGACLAKHKARVAARYALRASAKLCPDCGRAKPVDFRYCATCTKSRAAQRTSRKLRYSLSRRCVNCGGADAQRDSRRCPACEKSWTAYMNAYHKERRKTDPEYRIRCLLRGRIRGAIRAYTDGAHRACSAVRDLGCSVQDLMCQLEDQMAAGMSWNNYGREWHIDHIKPLASFDLTDPEQQRRAVHYTNLQPLWKADNLSKGARII